VKYSKALPRYIPERASESHEKAPVKSVCDLINIRTGKDTNTSPGRYRCVNPLGPKYVNTFQALYHSIQGKDPRWGGVSKHVIL
jgi:hypothetical protein